ncbi:diacylglycerol kinase family protein [Actinomyces bouchesdurhonensis]|uniref:diacylglycerol/lipid kinase family protein n=1 Tax=Actinomyces bouchesdurhonensis TaxID=1852361 RepID=UPI0028EAF8FC|nr:diacylglycerol kinase family protein [Actinomyces bouchesdurhonensis]
MDAIYCALAASAAAGVVGVARLATALTRRHRRRRALEVPASVDDPTRGRPRPWIIMNPSKHEDPQAFKDRINRKAKELGIDHVHWRETTREDPGTGQAVRAVEEGASVVIAAGGDGTVRAVAAGMAGSGVRMGIIPVGTGNVLAGNLSIPEDPEAALAVALDRNHRAVDLAWVRIEGTTQKTDQPAEGGLRLAARAATPPQATLQDEAAPASSIEPRADEYACLVVAGMGYDGETMADTDPELKKRIGWIAYVWAGLGAMGAPRMKARLMLRSPSAPVPDPLGVGDQISGEIIDEARAASRRPDSLRSHGDEVTRLEARSVMFANAGEMKMLVLAPDAELSDGLIDVIAVDAHAGPLGWADVTWKMLGQLIGLRPINLPVSTGTVAFRQAKGASVTAEEPQVCQVDGDAIGLARTMHVRMHAGALDVAVPAERTWMELLPS